MSKLIRANFARLWKSRIFWLGMAFSVGLSVSVLIMRYIDVKQNPEIYAALDKSYSNADGLIFVGGLYLIFAVAVFIGIFVGTEYSDGTLRNKVIIGHSRGSIYLSNLIVCAAADIMMLLTYIIVSLLLGELLIGGTTMTAKQILLFTLSSTTAIVGLTALLLLFSMLIRSKSIGSVTILLSTILMMFATIIIFQRLSAPEYNEGYAFVDEETGKTIEVEKQKNAKYLTGTKREIYEFLNDFIPTSQLYQIVMNDSSRLDIMAIYDGILLFITTGAGIVIFRRKDLK